VSLHLTGVGAGQPTGWNIRRAGRADMASRAAAWEAARFSVNSIGPWRATSTPTAEAVKEMVRSEKTGGPGPDLVQVGQGWASVPPYLKVEILALASRPSRYIADKKHVLFVSVHIMLDHWPNAFWRDPIARSEQLLR